MGMMSEIMEDIHQLMNESRMTPEQQQEVFAMMNQMSDMMRQMTTPQPREVDERHHRQLTEMQRRLKVLKRQVKKQPKGPVSRDPSDMRIAPKTTKMMDLS
jgi:hypothetical protein